MIPPSTDPEEGATRRKIRICETFINDHIKVTLYALMWEQRSEIMRQMIEEHDTFSAVPYLAMVTGSA